MSKPSNVVWEYVTDDKYELPIYTADSATDLARKMGLSPDSVRSAYCIAKKRGTNTRYRRVVLDKED